MAEPRRQWVVLGVLVVIASAGCLGFVTGSDALEFSANETVVGDGALEETGYQEAGNASIGDTVEVTLAGQTRQANITNYLYVYNRSVDLSEANVSAAVGEGSENVNDVATEPGNASVAAAEEARTSSAVQFSVLASPTQRVGGQSINPFAQLSTEELAKRFLEATDTSENLRLKGNRTVQSLGDERTVSTFRTSDGDNRSENDALVHVATFETGNDFIVVVGIHPAALDEEGRVDALIAGLEQPWA